MDDPIHVEVEMVERVFFIKALHDERVAVRQETEHLGNPHLVVRVSFVSAPGTPSFTKFRGKTDSSG